MSDESDALVVGIIAAEIVAALRELALESHYFKANPKEPPEGQLDPLVAKAKERIANAINPT